MPLDNPQELFYWVNENDKVLGSITRGEAHSGSKKIHRSVVVFIFTPDNQKVILQQRSLKKDTCPGFWGDSVGGHVTFGQTYKEAIIREAQEELGLTNLHLHFHSKNLFDLDVEREYYAIYTTHLPETTSINFDRDEIQQTLWVKVSTMDHFLNTHTCTPGLHQSWLKVKVRLPV